MIKAIIFDWGRTLYDKENERLFPETNKVLTYCGKRYKLAIVSLAVDGDIEGRFRLIDEYTIREHFQFMLFHEKDKDSLFRNALGNFGLAPKQVLVVDDRMKRLQWAIQQGCKTVWIKKGKFSKEEPDAITGFPTHTITSLQELLGIV